MIINKLLKIIVYDGNGSIYGNKKSISLRDIRGAIPSSGWYLHGRLADMVGYDKGLMLNAKKLGFVDRNNESNIVGIIPVFIYNIPESCIGYFWVEEFYGSSIQRGNVCLFSDREGRADALEMLKINIEIKNCLY